MIVNGEYIGLLTVKIDINTTEIRTGHLPNTILQFRSYISLLGTNGVMGRLRNELQ
jgi:hypothetical protein